MSALASELAFDVARMLFVVAIGAGAVWLAWWLLIETEGVYLGRRVVIWLYDLYASRYDGIKNFHAEYDHMFLAQPLLQLLIPRTDPLVLDAAAGTGRMALALLNHAHFSGRVISVDLSTRMLAIAQAKLDGDPRAPLALSAAETLPFAAESFDVVTCLEALEFMEQPATVLAELARVLKPDGVLLTTQRIRTRLMPGKTWSDDDLRAALDSAGFTDVTVEYWQVDYNRVWARKT